MSDRASVFAAARERLDALFADTGGHTAQALGDMGARRISDRGLLDTDTVYSTVVSAWRYSLNRGVELRRREDGQRWLDFYEVYADLVGELKGARPSVKDFVDEIAAQTDWPQDQREEMVALIDRQQALIEASGAGVAASEPESGEVVDESKSEVAAEPEPVTDSATPAPARKRAKKTKKQASKSAGRGPRIEVGPLSDNDGRGEVAVTASDMEYRVTELGEQVDAKLIESGISVNNPHAYQGVSNVGVYAAQKAVETIESGLRSRGVKLTGNSVGRGTAVTAALIAVLGLDEDETVELSPVLAEAVEILRTVRSEQTSLRVMELSRELAQVRELLDSVGLVASRVLHQTEVSGRLSATMVADRSGLARLPVADGAEEIEIMSIGAQGVYEQATEDVRLRAEKEEARQRRSRRG